MLKVVTDIRVVPLIGPGNLLSVDFLFEFSRVPGSYERQCSQFRAEFCRRFGHSTDVGPNSTRNVDGSYEWILMGYQHGIAQKFHTWSQPADRVNFKSQVPVQAFKGSLVNGLRNSRIWPPCPP